MIVDRTLHWSESILPVLDFETTGVNPREDRIVTAALVFTTPKGRVLECSYSAIVNPGVEIPTEASDIHGITTAVAQAQGIEPMKAVSEIITLLRGAYYLNLPLVIYNASYDWQMLHAEAERLGIADEVPPLYLLDPLVIDRSVDQYRKGGRKLAAVCEHYGVPLSDAHESFADAVASAELMRAICKQWPAIAAAPLELLQEKQRDMHSQWVRGMNDYWKRIGKEERIEEVEWPGVTQPQLSRVA